MHSGYRNDCAGSNVYKDVRTRAVILSLLAAGALAAAYSEYDSARQKLDRIESDKLRSGTRVELTAREVTAWVEKEAPQGVRNPQVQLVAPGVARGTALINFNKLQRAQGYEPGWLMSKLLDGEHPVAVTARIRSSNGRATVDVDRAEISGLVIDGKTLDFLVQNFVMPYYPDAAIGRPFELGHRIERLDVEPASVGVVIGR